MLTPEYLEKLPLPILEIYEKIEDDILRDMARRIATYDYWIPSADWQNMKLKEAGRMQDDILRIMSEYTGRTEIELRELMQKATSDGLRSDVAVYESHGETVPTINDSTPLLDTLNAGYAATRQTMYNLTRTTAQTATRQFERSLDRAWLQVRSGAFSHQTAVRTAIKDLARAGVQCITYPSGHTDTLEVAVRRAVVTGINQTTCQLQDKLADELECDLVEVSAHEGARPEHAEWQGKIFSRRGKSTKYPDFVKSTGYGSGAGLGGWNCRHSFSPYYEGSPRAYTSEMLREYSAKNIKYNGKRMTEYEASQQQRYMERQIRRWKRENAAMEAAGLDTSESAVKINSWQAALKDFTKQTGLKRQSDREQIAGYGRSQAAKVRASAVLKNSAGQSIIRVKKVTLTGAPNSITQRENAKGGIDRNYYDSEGKQTKQISNNDHGHKKESKFGNHGEHAHDYYFVDGLLKHGPARELTEIEREENSDIL